MKLHHWFATLLCCMLSATSSLAEEALPWYEVEIIIFTRDIQPASLSEAWPSDPGTPDFEHARPLQADPADKVQPIEAAAEGGIDDLNSAANLNLPTASPDIADENSTPAGNSGLAGDLPTPGTATLGPPGLPAAAELQQLEPYALLPEDEFRLKSEFSRLQRSRGLQPEIHLAWRQPVSNQKNAQLLYLRTPYAAAESKMEIDREREEEGAGLVTESGIFGGLASITTAEPPGLEGTIRISVSRYLHVELDLLRRIRSATPYPSYEQSFEGGLTEQAQPYHRYRMQAHRRMRSGELHYIDHPLMGVLIKITPYELPTPAEPVEPEATAPLRQAEGVNAEKPREGAAEQEPVPAPPEPGTTRSIIGIPVKPAEETVREQEP